MVVSKKIIFLYALSFVPYQQTIIAGQTRPQFKLAREIEPEHASEGDKLLYHAIQDGDLEKITSLLQKQVNINAKDIFEQTSLYGAIKNQRKNIVQYLLEHGAQTNIFDGEGDTPLHEAAEGANVEIIKLLLSHGAKIDAINNRGYMPLHVAVQCERPHNVKLLVENGSQDESEDESNFFAPKSIPLALKSNNQSIVSYLEHCQNYMESKTKIPNGCNDRPIYIMLAILKQDISEIKDLLLEQEKDISSCLQLALKKNLQKSAHELAWHLVQKKPTTNIEQYVLFQKKLFHIKKSAYTGTCDTSNKNYTLDIFFRSR